MTGGEAGDEDVEVGGYFNHVLVYFVVAKLAKKTGKN